MNIYLERMLFDKMKESMQKYQQFLLQFMLRKSEFCASGTIALDRFAVKIREKPLTEIKVKVVRYRTEAGGSRHHQGTAKEKL